MKMSGKYLVLALMWDDELKEVAEFIIGEFTEYRFVELFCNAYKKKYYGPARIVYR
jgi:hypothetical protein